jgi:hypothetical protein
MPAIKNLLNLYSPKYLNSLVNLLSTSHYEVKPYLKLLNSTKDFVQVVKKDKILKDKQNRNWLITLRAGVLLQIIAGLVLIYLGLSNHLSGGAYFGLAVIICYPIVWAYLLALLLLVSKWSFTLPN